MDRLNSLSPRQLYAGTGRQLARAIIWIIEAVGAVLVATAIGMLAAVIVGILLGFGPEGGFPAFVAAFLGCFWQSLGRWLLMLVYSAIWGAVWAGALFLSGFPFNAGWLLATVAVIIFQWAKLASQEPVFVEEPQPPPIHGPTPRSPTPDLGDFLD